jgi:hypothetical protein
MKKLLLFFVALTLVNCSTEDSDNSSNSNSRASLKINSTNFSELLVHNSSTNQMEHSLEWYKTDNGDGTFSYGISGYITSSTETSLGNDAYFSIDLGEDIVQGQIINVNSPDFELDIAYTLSASNVGYRNWNGTTTGQIKITHFDGVTMSGEFSYANVVKYTDNPIVGEDYSNNTVVGTFSSITNSN